ncbi:MAG: chemotaxis protein CheW [Candidatus Omnitrophica bacterium]|nr:chemotaxis protein CheW [Candidatus Omnitrophota bacterium]
MVEDKAKEYQLVVFTIGDEEFGVDINQVREIVRLVQITYLPKAPQFIEGVVNLRGQVLAVIDLSKKLNIEAKARSDSTRIVIVEVGENTVGMIVGSVSEVLRLPFKNVEEVPSIVDTEIPEHYIKGVGKLKDRLLVLLDLNRILTPEEVQHVEKQVKNLSAKEAKDQEPQ